MAATKYTYKDYVESKKVKQAQTALENHNKNKPGEYTSLWTGQMNDTLNKIQNRGPFSYDLTSDALYQQYADRYAQLGKMAMQDTTGQAAALTGGYGNSYALTAGNQAYQKYLQGINDIVPELQQMAYDRYNQQGQDLLNLYGLYSDRENTDYSRWQNSLTNWQNERAYLSDYYNNERTYDRSVYDTDRTFDYGKWTDNRNYDYQVARDKVQDEQWAKEFAESQRQFNLNYNLQKKKSSDNSGVLTQQKIQKAANSDATKLFQASIMTKSEVARRGATTTVDGKQKRFDNYEQYVDAVAEKWYKEGKLSENEVAYIKGYYGID